jgi:uncharacterized protein (TIGR00369 family)
MINPDYETVVRQSFARQTFMTALGAVLERVAPGEVDVSVPFSPRHTQQNGFLHAGVITSVADSANGYAAFTLAPPGYDVLAVEFKINLLRPATAQRFLACARVLRAGRTLTVSQAEVFGLDENGGARRELIATMTSTIILRPIHPPHAAGPPATLATPPP